MDRYCGIRWWSMGRRGVRSDDELDVLVLIQTVGTPDCCICPHCSDRFSRYLHHSTSPPYYAVPSYPIPSLLEPQNPPLTSNPHLSSSSHRTHPIQSLPTRQNQDKTQTPTHQTTLPVTNAPSRTSLLPHVIEQHEHNALSSSITWTWHTTHSPQLAIRLTFTCNNPCGACICK